VLVLAAVPHIFAAKLRRAAGQRFTFCWAENWSCALDSIRNQPVEMAVVDPGLDGEPRSQEVERLRVLFPSLPLILYAKLSPAIVPVLLRVGEAGIRQVLLDGYDDHPARLSDALVDEAARVLSRQLMVEIDDVLEGFPRELKWALETMVREPGSFHTVQDLADRARMDRRTCTRWFTKAHLPPPSVMLTVIRVVYAHRLLQDPGYTVEDVAAKLGYAKPRSFAVHVRDVFGMTPGDLRVSLAPDEAVRIVRSRYFDRENEPLESAS